MTTNQTIDGVPRVLLNADREMRVYIAGPMTGIADYNFPAFNAMADKMRAAGWHVENPADHGLVVGADWADYLRYDIGCLASCEAIMLLPGWTASRGARLEVSIAKELGVVFMFADGAEREPAAQPQGEPVARITLEQVLKAYDYANCHPHKYLRGTTNWCAAVAHSLNAEQPAPVAVVMPERREPTQDNPYLSDADHEWNAYRDELKRLNPSL